MNKAQRDMRAQDTGLGVRGADRQRAKDLPLLRRRESDRSFPQIG